jgi:hypothetical protein
MGERDKEKEKEKHQGPESRRSKASRGVSRVESVKNPAKRLGSTIRRIEQSRDAFHMDGATDAPFFSRRVLDVAVANSSSGTILVGRSSSSFVVLVEKKGQMGEIQDPRGQSGGNLARMNSSHELGFGRARLGR